MPTQINPYLTFKGNCEEAMNFYKEVFGGDLKIQKVGESAMSADMPDMKDQVMHSELRNGHIALLASDMAPEELVHGTTMTLCVICSTKEEIESFHSKLSKDAKSVLDLRTEFWGATYGEVVDKYGFRWMFNFDASQKAA